MVTRRHSCVLLATFGLSFSCATAPAVQTKGGAPTPARMKAIRGEHRLEPKHLSETARALIQDRMQTHGEDMTVLFWSIVFLDAESARYVSDFLAAEPAFARPRPGSEDTINALLPERFYELQDAFTEKARAMRAIAAKSEAKGPELARAFGELAATCVACHSVYLEEPGEASSPMLDREELQGLVDQSRSYFSVTRVRGQ